MTEETASTDTNDIETNKPSEQKRSGGLGPFSLVVVILVSAIVSTLVVEFGGASEIITKMRGEHSASVPTQVSTISQALVDQKSELAKLNARLDGQDANLADLASRRDSELLEADAALAQSLARLDGRVSEIADLAQSAKDQATQSQAGSSISLVSARIDDALLALKTAKSELEEQAARLSALEDQQSSLVADNQQIREDVAGMVATIDPTYQDKRDDAVRLLAASRLRAVLAQTGNFRPQLQAFGVVARGADELEALAGSLAPIADQATPSIEALGDQLDTIWSDLDSLSKADPEATEGLSGVFNRVSSFVSIRRVDSRGEDNLAGWLADAQEALSQEQGGPDFVTVEARLARVPQDLGQRSQAYSAWLQNYQNRKLRFQAAQSLESWTNQLGSN